MLSTKITAALIAVAAVGAAFAMPMAAQASTPAASDEVTERARGTVAFRTERYQLSERAIVSTTPTTIRIVDDSARTQSGTKAGLYIQFGYAHDPRNPTVLRVNSGVAVRGYDFATGTYPADQAIEFGSGALSIDSPLWSDATHMWGHLNSQTERGIDIDVHGVHFGSPS
jgi:hypothetical protein